ncbi:MAG: serine/threonine-protein kinase [Polyangiales bacterium]
MPTPGSLPPSGNLPSDRRLAFGRVAALAAFFLPLFGLLDVLMVATLHPEVALARALAIRFFGMLFALLARWIAIDVRFSDRVAEIAHGLVLAVSAAMMAVLASMFGGPASPYVHGLSIAFIVRATVVPSSLRESLAYGGLLLATYLGVLAAIVVVEPGFRPAWSTTETVVSLLASYLVIIAVIVGGAVGSRATFAARSELSRARRIGRYRLEAPIGRGGQNEVWLAWDTRLGRQVALKLLPPDARARDARALFEREAKLASQLAGPNTVRVYDFSASDDGFSYLATEYLEGEDLSTLVATHGPLPESRVIHFGKQVCRALEEAHGLGLIHRDVKPGNLRVTRHGDERDVVKLLDFGIACCPRMRSEGVTRGATVRGTPTYMSPESCRGQEASIASDIYSLGATLYHLLAGTPPFVGDDFQLVASHLDEAPEPIALRRGSPVASDLEAVVLRCLAKDPRDRFESADSLRRALEACVDAGRWSARDAEAFWSEERSALVARYQADTQA